MSFRERISRLFGSSDESWQGEDRIESESVATSQSLIQRGIVNSGGNHLILVHPETPIKGVKLVTVTVEFSERHERVMAAYESLQGELSRLPQSLRPRKPNKRKVKMPELET